MVILSVYSALPWITNNEIGRDELKSNGGAVFVGGGEGNFGHDFLICFNVMVRGLRGGARSEARSETLQTLLP